MEGDTDTFRLFLGTLQNVVCVGSPPGFHHSHHQGPADAEACKSLSVASTRSVLPQARNTPTGEAYPKGCGFRGSRGVFQDELTRLNPKWAEFASEMERNGTEPKTNPDGDVSG